MEKLTVIRTVAELKALEQYLADKDFIAFDTETTGVDQDAQIIGFSVCADIEEAFYVVTSYWDREEGRLIDTATKDHCKPVFELLLKKNLIMHNAPFDCRMVAQNYGVQLIKAVHTDTLVLAHLLDENRRNGLKPLGVSIFGEDADKEEKIMKASVEANGGKLNKVVYELYKGDSELIGRYGAKDTILTLKLFWHLVPELYAQGLDTFFYEEESMPLLRGPTYDLNSTGLRIDPAKLSELRMTLETEILEDKGFILNEILPMVTEKYTGTSKLKTFNIGSNKQLSWVLFVQMGLLFNTITKEGKVVARALGLDKLPYTNAAKRQFLELFRANVGKVWKEGVLNPETGKVTGARKVGEVWNYLACGKETLALHADQYPWIKALLRFKQNEKLLKTYVLGIQDRMRYNVIQPSFIQTGTTSGRYSCKNPNFQNLPAKDKRVKSCIIARKGKVFVGADYEQLEPRVFASFSGDERLLQSFEDGDDFYSVIGMEVFGKYDCNMKKSDTDPEFFGNKYKKLRDIAKTVALSATYGTTAPKMAMVLGKSMDEAQDIIDNYFETFPKVKKMMLNKHQDVMKHGQAMSLFGRPRRLPQALLLKETYGNTEHKRLPYEARKTLNLGVNHPIQGTGAGIMNRAAIAFKRLCEELAVDDPRWNEVFLISQIHDELIAEAPEALGDEVVLIMQHAMENTVTLPGVRLIAKPKVARVMADLK